MEKESLDIPEGCPGKLNAALHLCHTCCLKRGTIYCALDKEDNIMNAGAEHYKNTKRKEEEK